MADQRAALGHSAALGQLYDAKTDTVMQGSILRPCPLNDAVINISQDDITTLVSEDDTFSAKCAALGIQMELAASIAAGLAVPMGASVYLNQVRDTNHTIRAALFVRKVTYHQKLNIMRAKERCLFNFNALASGTATHVVVGIDWGMQSIVTVQARSHHGQRTADMKDAVRSELEGLHTMLDSASDQAGFPKARTATLGEAQAKTNPNTIIIAYKDTLSKSGLLMQDIQDAAEFVQLPERDVPICYTLYGIEMLATMLQEDLPIPKMVHLSRDLLDTFIQNHNQLRNDLQTLSDHYQLFERKRKYLDARHAEEILDTTRMIEDSKTRSKEKFASALEATRAGSSTSAPLLEANRIAEQATIPDHARDILSLEVSRLQFIEETVALGATYIGYNGLNLQQALRQPEENNHLSYVLQFSRAAMADSTTWDPNLALFMDLVKQSRTTDCHGLCFMLDADANSQGFAPSKATILTYANGVQTNDDMVEERAFMDGKCFARCPKASLDTINKERPLKRRFAKFACPGPGCDAKEACEWTCGQCMGPLEFGHTDTYIYCECGRAQYDQFEFRCNGDSHGSGYVRYQSDKLLETLKKLQKVDSLNILILGETGVGKSTFINAFVNYLTFDSLDQAKNTKDLNWVIPCSFNTQIMDRSREDGQITQVKIDIGKGSRDDEQDGSKGNSATQETTVYPITIDGSTIRLIDTPGIGDTRGLSQDKKNMADILNTLGSYDDLHGILILLKPNNSRLNISFRFCVKELLTHLHRSAAANMAFGFTNTRISNYTPGDTYGPLNTLLGEHPDIGLELNMKTAYCFDSESFRYLAAFKHGHTLPNEEDFRRSWEHSSTEARRLVNHFRTLKPHLVKSTISLDWARRLIQELTKPMAQISQVIQANIAVNKDRVQELQDTRLTGDKLRQRLTLQRLHLRTKLLIKPRTVCQNPACCEYKDDGSGENRVVTVYKSICHPVCYLRNVDVNKIAHPGLQDCRAFKGNVHCQDPGCGHHWQEHLHILYELEEYMGTVIDLQVQSQLRANATDTETRYAALETAQKLIEEYQDEHQQVREATARFVLFLKERCMTAINDATVDYLNMLISDEEAKVHLGGGNDKKLNSLKEDLKQHEELVKTMTMKVLDNKQANRPDGVLTEDGVGRLVRQLYKLPHFGKDLQNIKDGISTAHAATYRERPYRVQKRGARHLPRVQGDRRAGSTQITHYTLPAWPSTDRRSRSRSRADHRRPSRLDQRSYTRKAPSLSPGETSAHRDSSEGSRIGRWFGSISHLYDIASRYIGRGEG